MKIAIVVSLAFLGHASIAGAETPIFKLPPHTINSPRSTRAVNSNVDSGSPNTERDRFRSPIPASSLDHPKSSAIKPHIVFIAAQKSQGVWPHANTATTELSSAKWKTALPNNRISSTNFIDDSLYHFLKNFKGQPPPKPDSWTLLLVVLCLTLYQIRRRPVRASIGFVPY